MEQVVKHPRRVMTLAVVSAILSYALVWVAANGEEQTTVSTLARYSPGVVYALLVLIPMLNGVAARWLRAVLVVVASGAIYFVAVRIADQFVTGWRESPLAGCGIAGGLAAVMMAAVVRTVLDRQISLLATLIAFCTGSLGGALIGQAFLTPESEPAVQGYVASGYLVWQVGVSFALLLIDPMGFAEPDRN
jgi:hypothetical protein